VKKTEIKRHTSKILIVGEDRELTLIDNTLVDEFDKSTHCVIFKEGKKQILKKNWIAFTDFDGKVTHCHPVMIWEKSEPLEEST
jgi:hypothetical protein